MRCLFCDILAGDVAAKKVYEDKQLLAFEDIAPAAPLHLLLIPKQHISTLNEVREDHQQMLGALMWRAALLAQKKGYAEAGYRVVMNCNAGGGQSVFHIHLHLLAGRALNWPPG